MAKNRCEKCGKYLVGDDWLDEYGFCRACHVDTGIAIEDPRASRIVIVDKPSFWTNIIAFFIPLLGLIMYLSERKQYPIKAGAIGKWSLIGFAIGLILRVATL